MYATEDKSRAVFFAYKTDHFINMTVPFVRMSGLGPDRNYRITDLTPVRADKPCPLDGKVISGKVLKEEGIALSKLLTSEYASLALELRAVE